MYTERITFLATKEMKKELEKLAKEDQRTLGAFIRLLLKRGLKG